MRIERPPCQRSTSLICGRHDATVKPTEIASRTREIRFLVACCLRSGRRSFEQPRSGNASPTSFRVGARTYNLALVAVRHDRKLPFDDLQAMAHSPYNRDILRTSRRMMHNVLCENDLNGGHAKLEYIIERVMHERN